MDEVNQVPIEGLGLKCAASHWSVSTYHWEKNNIILEILPPWTHTGGWKYPLISSTWLQQSASWSRQGNLVCSCTINWLWVFLHIQIYQSTWHLLQFMHFRPLMLYLFTATKAWKTHYLGAICTHAHTHAHQYLSGEEYMIAVANGFPEIRATRRSHSPQFCCWIIRQLRVWGSWRDPSKTVYDTNLVIASRHTSSQTPPLWSNRQCVFEW